ncbi:MAG TPA: phosphotransferase, partial [Euzebyales bacterium]|nr:phosphotransferase [Euzebyales bacterium]
MRTHADRSQAPALVIEVAGPPGAGKTSLLPAVLRACEAVGLRPYTVDLAARAFARRTAAGRLAARLPAALGRRALWAVFYLGSAVGAARLAWRRPAMAWYVARTQSRRPAGADVTERRVLYWYFRTAGAYEFLRRLGRPGEAVIIDEGFVHRAVQLHASSVERPEQPQIAAYVRSLPPSDLLVVVRAPAALCHQRVSERGVWQRLQHRDADEVGRFVANAHLAIEHAADALRDGAATMIEIDNSQDIATAEMDLETRLKDALSRIGPEPKTPWTPPRIRVPRSARLGQQLSARRRPPVIDPGTCERILGHYGLALSGRPANVAFGRRNDNVIVMTPAGRKVLRRHRTTAEPTSVAHEHAVLTELERRRFPAVRLQRTVTGDTAVADGDRLFALLDFEHGDNLSSYLLPGRTSWQRILTIAGRTLARLHGELAAFAPATAHHLGYHPSSGERAHDLDWYLDALATLPQRVPTAGPRGRDHHRALAAKSSETAARLAAIHDVVARAPLPQVMIHGDY